MQCAQRALLELQQAGDTLISEICVYMPLAAVQAGEHIGQWLARQWRALAPKLDWDEVRTAEGPRLRLLLDGINEITADRQGVISALVNWLKSEGAVMLPAVFSVRTLEQSVAVGAEDFAVPVAAVKVRALVWALFS